MISLYKDNRYMLSVTAMIVSAGAIETQEAGMLIWRAR